MSRLLLFILFLGVAPAYAITPSFIGAISSGSVIGCSYADPDWSTWDGTNDGTLVRDLLSGQQWNTGAYAQVDGNTSLHVYSTTDDGGTSYRLEAALVDVNACDKTLTRNTPTVLHNFSSGFGLPDITRMSSTRLLTHTHATVEGNSYFHLIDESGTVVDTHTVNSTIYNGASARMTTHDSNTAVMAYKQQGGSGFYLVAIDVTGDTISLGTPVAWEASETSVAQKGIAALSSTRGLVTTDLWAYRYTLSGTTITVGPSFHVSPTTNATITFGKPANMLKVAEDTALVFSKRNNDLYAALVTDDGTTQTKVDTVTVQANDTADWKNDNLTQLEQFVSGSADGYYMGAYQLISDSDGYAAMIKWDGTNLTVPQNIKRGANDATAEHLVVHQFQNGSVVFHYQDSTLWDWRVLTP